MPADAPLPTKLKQLRNKSGLSLRSAAAGMNIQGSLLSKMEKGLTAKPTQTNLRKIAEFYDINPDELYTLAGYEIATDLPDYTPYLRSKYGDDLPPEAVDELRSHFDYIKTKYKPKKPGDD